MTSSDLTLSGATRSRAAIVLLGVMAATLLGLLFVPPIPQDQSYHQFADQRTLLGVPNFWNVPSNLPFIAVGAWGLWHYRPDATATVIFLGILLTGFGSSYYHWAPSDGTLFWDRLPMALSFMGIFAWAIGERVNERLGAVMLWPLLAIGVFSLLLWRWTDDLRLYAWVQFFPCLALPVLFLLPAKYTGTSYWILAAAFYASAKLLEYFDRAILSVGSLISGHSLKHVAAAAACYMILRYYQTREPVEEGEED